MQEKKLTMFWLLGALICTLLVLIIVFSGISGKVRVTDPEGIREAAENLLEAVRTGDWESLNDVVAGDPIPAPAMGAPDSAERLIFEAYQNSLQWSIQEDYQIQGPYVTQKVNVSCLDIVQVTSDMAEILKNTESSDPAFLRSAAETVLNSASPLLQRDITLTFRREAHQWRAVPNSALQTLLSGFITH